MQRKLTPHRYNPITLLTAGVRKVHCLRSKNKQFGYMAIVMVLVLAIPLAVRAISGDQIVNDELRQAEVAPEQYVDQPIVKTVPTSSNKEGVESMKSDITVKSKSKISGEGSENSDVDVRVNGQNVPVPKNGSIYKQVSGSDGKTTVDVQVNNGSSSSQSSSSSTVIIEQYSHSSGDVTSEEGGVSSRHPDRR